VELRGFEPLTSSMPWKRATNCAKAPSVSFVTTAPNETTEY
jgi:site-specific DNA recombinase